MAEMAETVDAPFMHIQLNGERRMVVCGATITALLHDLQIRHDRIAVEVNQEIVDRREFDRLTLQEGDRVEVISFIGGGGTARPACRPCSRSAHEKICSLDVRS